MRRVIVEAARRSRYGLCGHILILGGSTGAVGLNSAVIGALPAIAETQRRVLHQAGQTDVERVRTAYTNAGVDADVRPFIDDMGAAYAKAALVIARAGGTTLAEIALFGLPSVLVPYPHHRDRHQRANAEVFERAGAAQIIEENSAAPAALAGFLRTTLTSSAGLEGMHAASLSLGRPEAADTVAGLLQGLIHKSD